MRANPVLALLLSSTALLAPVRPGLTKEPPAAKPPSYSIYAMGLNNPRGLKFGPDGDLYVAEGGVGGSNPPSTDPACGVVPDGVGPYSGSATGSRISRIDRWGRRETFVDNLPSSQTSADAGGFVSGVADVAWVDGQMYAILAGAGCSHGVPGIPNGVIRIHHDRSWTVIADLSAFVRAHPVENPNLTDFEPDGTWYSMIAVDGALYAVEPNHGEIDRISTEGHVSRLVDISASQGHVVPTALAFHDGKFFLGNLGVFPQDAGSSDIWKVTQQGRIKLDTSGFNMVLGLLFDREGRLYVLQNSAAPAPAPGTGSVVRIERDGKRTTIIDGLFLPTAMTFGPDGDLYISNVGYGAPPSGQGQIIKVDLRERCD